MERPEFSPSCIELHYVGLSSNWLCHFWGLLYEQYDIALLVKSAMSHNDWKPPLAGWKIECWCCMVREVLFWWAGLDCSWLLKVFDWVGFSVDMSWTLYSKFGSLLNLASSLMVESNSTKVINALLNPDKGMTEINTLACLWLCVLGLFPFLIVPVLVIWPHTRWSSW